MPMPRTLQLAECKSQGHMYITIANLKEKKLKCSCMKKEFLTDHTSSVIHK